MILSVILPLLPHLSTPNPMVSQFPGQCETIERKGERWKRVRLPVDRAQVELEIRAVAEEMGADPNLLIAIAKHESSMTPSALHILEADRKAGLAAWRGATYSEERMFKLEKIVEQGPRDPRYYRARASILRMQRYRDNVYWNVETPVGEQQENVWAWGYGLYGMASVLYTAIWDPTSPPWVLCDPTVASITLVWALRAQTQACGSRTVGQTIARFGSGECGTPLRKGWLRLVPSPEAPARLGTKWPKETTVRAELIMAVKQRLTG